MPFVKGQSGNPGGRKAGVPDKVSQEVRQLARKLFDKAYWQRTKQRLAQGKLPPFIEAKLLAYAFGEPQADKANGSGITVNIGFLAAPTTPQLAHVAVLPALSDGTATVS